MRIKIAETTREERERIVAESLGKIDAACDGCSPGLIEMYQDYIEGRRELREIKKAAKEPQETVDGTESLNYNS